MAHAASHYACLPTYRCSSFLTHGTVKFKSFISMSLLQLQLHNWRLAVRFDFSSAPPHRPPLWASHHKLSTSPASRRSSWIYTASRETFLIYSTFCRRTQSLASCQTRTPVGICHLRRRADISAVASCPHSLLAPAQQCSALFRLALFHLTLRVLAVSKCNLPAKPLCVCCRATYWYHALHIVSITVTE